MSEEIYVKASPETITEILELVKSKPLGLDIKIIDLCPDYKWDR